MARKQNEFDGGIFDWSEIDKGIKKERKEINMGFAGLMLLTVWMHP